MTESHSEGDAAAAEHAPFRFEYGNVTLRYGDGCVAALGEELAELGVERALIVSGRTVGETAAVVDPVREGMGDRCAGVFAGTTPEKRFATAVDGLAAMREADADALVGLGGGSSIDVARAVAALAGSDRGPDALAAELAATGSLPVPDRAPPVVAVPTTFAGADLSQGGGVTGDPEEGFVDERVDGGVWGPSLFPAAAFYDPALFETTPRGVLAASAMNGFDKGLETPYSRHRTAITDATAARGLGRFADGLLAFDRNGEFGHEAGLPAAVEGLVLVQYGVSRSDATTLSVIHALAKQVSRAGGIHQGVAHAIVAPHVLSLVFDRVDGRRALLADALGVDGAGGAPAGPSDAAETADAVVDRVTAVRDALGVPTRLRDADGPSRGDFEGIADAALAHPFFENAPAGLDATEDDLAEVLEAAW